MKTSKNEKKETSNGNTHGNDNSSQAYARDGFQELNPNSVAGRKYGTFDFGINQEFIQENIKNKHNLAIHRQNPKQKFAPFTRSQRRKRRMEVYKLHFEHGVPATRIAEVMKVDRNTINNDLKILYKQSLDDYNPKDISLDDILQKQLVRLETQRDRLCLYLCDAEDVNSKIAIERLIADIDFKLIGAIDKLNHNIERFWEEIIKQLNKTAEDKKMDVRYTSLFELRKISLGSRKSLDKLTEEVLK
jgi:hypothetical protein